MEAATAEGQRIPPKELLHLGGVNELATASIVAESEPLLLRVMYTLYHVPCPQKTYSAFGHSAQSNAAMPRDVLGLDPYQASAVSCAKRGAILAALLTLCAIGLTIYGLNGGGELYTYIGATSFGTSVLSFCLANRYANYPHHSAYPHHSEHHPQCPQATPALLTAGSEWCCCLL